MSMNREQKRQLQRQKEIDSEGAPVRTKRQGARQTAERVGPRQFLREVRGELRKVAWPTRAETVHYSIVVLVTVVVLGVMIYGLDWLFSTFVLELFEG